LDFPIIKKLESTLQKNVQIIELISGGDSSFSFELDIEGDKFFFKSLGHENALNNYNQEHFSLDKLRNTEIIAIPKVESIIIDQESAGLLLEWIERKIPNQEELELFGTQIARLHKTNHENYGWPQDNYISILDQHNDWTETWTSFYIEQRITPLLEKGIDSNLFPKSLAKQLSTIAKHVELEVPNEQPSLIHGDLWGGNFIISKDGTPYLIDPSCYYGHREMDIAMSLLFGSFGRHFYSAYQNEYPLQPGFEERLPLLQLYPLMVHAILFKGHYIDSVKNVFKKYQ